MTDDAKAAPPLNILVLEDSEADFLLLRRHLARHGLAARLTRVETEAEIDAALRGRFELMVSDYNVPGVDFLGTLHRVRMRCPDMPIILVSGNVGDERAVDLLHEGVTDFVLKENLIRLVPAIRRALEEAAEKEARRAAESAVRQQQERIRASEERLQLALDATNDGLWDWDMIRDLAYLSPQYYRMSGYEPGEVTPNAAFFRRLVHPDDHGPVLAAINAHWRGDSESSRIEYRMVTKGGDVRWVVGRGRVVARDPEGRPLRMVGTITDITDRKLAELALQESEAKFRLLAENAADCIFWVGPDYRLRYISPACQQVLGRPADAFQANPALLGTVIHPDDREAYRRHLAPEHVGHDHEMEFRVVLPDGGLHWIAHRCWPVRTADGRDLGRQGVNRDITAAKRDLAERLRNAEALQEAVARLTVMNTELERFAMVAAHDLREPARSVTSFAQMLERRCAAKLDDDERQYLQYLVGGARRIYDLIGGLLDYSRVPANAAPPHPTSADLACAMALDNLAGLVGEAGAEIVRDPLPVVEADEVLLMQVFQNLIGNALKFRDPDRRARVEIRAEREGGFWRFAVSDNGMGFDADGQDVFELFRQLQPGRHAGIGAGLAICKRIVQRLGGTIWADSRPGRGSTFQFTVPAAGAYSP